MGATLLTYSTLVQSSEREIGASSMRVEESWDRFTAGDRRLAQRSGTERRERKFREGGGRREVRDGVEKRESGKEVRAYKRR